MQRKINSFFVAFFGEVALRASSLSLGQISNKFDLPLAPASVDPKKVTKEPFSLRENVSLSGARMSARLRAGADQRREVTIDGLYRASAEFFSSPRGFIHLFFE